jgi:predicted PurR-regulated permease PerM
MKKVFLLLAMSFTLLSTAQEKVQDSVQVSTTVTEAERVIDKYSEKITTAIGSLAESLAVPAEYVYKILVKQAVVDSVVELLLLLTFTFLFIRCTRKFLTLMRKVDRYGDYLNEKANKVSGEADLIVNGVGAVILLVGLLRSLAYFSNMVTGFINPEFMAITEIIKMLK